VGCFDEHCQRVIRRLAGCDHLSVVVGAGASVAAGLPGWEKLVTRLLARRSSRRAKQVARHLIDTQGFLLAAEAAFPVRATKRQRKKAIARALYGQEDPASFLPSKLHQAVAGLAGRRKKGRIEIFTTNYDDLLEQAFRDEGLRCGSRYEAANPHGAGSFAIHHVHGLLGADAESEDVVLGQSDYYRIADAGSDWAGEEFGAAAAKGPVVFVGASLTDPNLLRILDRIRNRSYQRHVLVLARQGLGVPHELKSGFAQRISQQWARYGVDVVMLEDFSDISLFVRDVARANDSDYVGPRERVARLWSQISSRFSELQAECVGVLDRGFEDQLEKITGEEASLALWLADGRGRLILFAANDRIHRSPATLRTIPDRYDAGGPVTGALAFESSRIHQLQPGARWKFIAATPLRPSLLGLPPCIAGAVSAATVQLADPEGLGKILENQIATEWEARLERLILE
jgi:hypothetical protein